MNGVRRVRRILNNAADIALATRKRNRPPLDREAVHRTWLGARRSWWAGIWMAQPRAYHSDPGDAVTCRRAFPILIRGRTYYVTCDLPHGHDPPCTGRATDWGAPTL